MQIQKLISLPPGMVSHFHQLEGKDPGSGIVIPIPLSKSLDREGGPPLCLLLPIGPTNLKELSLNGCH